MQTFVLNADSANLSIEHLLKQVDSGGVEVRDSQGRLVAFVLSPTDRASWVYAEANLDLDQHLDELRKALERRGGSTTGQLLKNASADGPGEPSP